MRHASSTTTLNMYSHLWPDADESTRTAIGEVLAERMDSSGVSADRNCQQLVFVQLRASYDSHVVVQLELVRVRTQVDRSDFLLALE